MADKDDGNRLLVHCSAGVSRSPAIVLVHWLVCSKREKSVLTGAVRLVRKARPVVDISSDHLSAITEFHNNDNNPSKKKII